MTKHSIQRVIAISEVFESVNPNETKIYPETTLNHHSLRYYACF
jgi:hypothetical protein